MFIQSTIPNDLSKEISALAKDDIWCQGKAAIASVSTGTNPKSTKYPKGINKDVVGLIRFTGYSIHKDSKNKELCWELMEYIFSDYFQDKVLDLDPDLNSNWELFSRISVPTSAVSLDKPLSDYRKKTLQDLMASAGNTTTPDEYEYKILIEIMKAMQKVYGGQEDLEVILNQIDEYARTNVF